MASDNTKVLPCKCKHEFQDKAYGIGKRLHNFGRKLFNGQGGWRRTVCKDTKGV